MKLHLTNAEGQNLITGHGSGWVQINQTRVEHSLVVTPRQFIEWPVSSFETLTEAHFETLATLKPEILLLGTGARIHFPHPGLSRSLTELGIGIECMDTGAACRTYNILMSEGRNVAVALIITS
jgi:uncharacterized protein